MSASGFWEILPQWKYQGISTQLIAHIKNVHANSILIQALEMSLFQKRTVGKRQYVDIFLYLIAVECVVLMSRVK